MCLAKLQACQQPLKGPTISKKLALAAEEQADAMGWSELQSHLLDSTLADDMTGALEHREAEAAIKLQAGDGAHELCLIAWLEVPLRRNIGCGGAILILGKPVVVHAMIRGSFKLHTGADG